MLDKWNLAFFNNILSSLCCEVSLFCFGWLYLIGLKVETHTIGGNRKENDMSSLES